MMDNTRLLRSAAKEKLRKEPDIYMDCIGKSASAILYKLRLHKAELEIQNEHLREAQETIEESRQRYVQFFESSPIASLILDMSGEIRDLNTATLGLLSTANGKFFLRKPFSLCLARESKPAFMTLLEKMRRGSAREVCQVSVLRMDGQPVCMLLYAQPVRPCGTGEALLHLALADITERKEAEEQERRRSEHDRMTALSRMAGGVVHEINNALAVIIGNAEMAFEDEKDQMVKDNVGNVLDAATRIRETMKALLSFGVDENMNRRMTVFGDLVRETAATLEAATGGKVHFEVRVDDSLEPISADPKRVRQLVRNLCLNATEAIQEKRGVVEVAVERATAVELSVGKPTAVEVPTKEELPSEVENASYVVLKVKDTGKGIDESIMHRIFEPFFTTKQAGEGLGLGLSIAYGIVKKHDGHIAVESTAGKGTTVKVYFPISQEGTKSEAG